MRGMTLAAVLLAVAALAVPVDAQMQPQDPQDPQSGEQRDMEQRGTRQRMAPQRQQVTGEIVEVRNVKVKLDTGETAVLDLGPAAKARQSGLKLDKRQQLQAEGMIGQLNDKPVLIVTRAQQDGKTVMLNTGAQHGSPQDDSQQRDAPSPGEGLQQTQYTPPQSDSEPSDAQQDAPDDMESRHDAPQERMTQVQGEIIDLSTVKSDQDQQEHLVAEIRLQQTGQTVKVDLGPADEARKSDLKLSEGQQIEVTGTIGRLNGTPVVVVQRAQQNGKSVMLNAGSQQQPDMQKQSP